MKEGNTYMLRNNMGPMGPMGLEALWRPSWVSTLLEALWRHRCGMASRRLNILCFRWHILGKFIVIETRGFRKGFTIKALELTGCLQGPHQKNTIFTQRTDPTDNVISMDCVGFLLNLQKTIPNPAGSGQSNQIRAYLGPGALQISIWPPA